MRVLPVIQSRIGIIRFDPGEVNLQDTFQKSAIHFQSLQTVADVALGFVSDITLKFVF